MKTHQKEVLLLQLLTTEMRETKPTESDLEAGVLTSFSHPLFNSASSNWLISKSCWASSTLELTAVRAGWASSRSLLLGETRQLLQKEGHQENTVKTSDFAMSKIFLGMIFQSISERKWWSRFLKAYPSAVWDQTTMICLRKTDNFWVQDICHPPQRKTQSKHIISSLIEELTKFKLRYLFSPLSQESDVIFCPILGGGSKSLFFSVVGN